MEQVDLLDCRRRHRVTRMPLGQLGTGGHGDDRDNECYRRLGAKGRGLKHRPKYIPLRIYKRPATPIAPVENSWILLSIVVPASLSMRNANRYVARAGARQRLRRGWRRLRPASASLAV